MPEPTLSMQLEAILFVATAPLTVTQLATATESTTENVTAELSTLAKSMSVRGIRLSELGGEYRLVTAPDTSAIVKRYLQDEAGADLSKAALETLAIIAYRGPLTKSAIEAVRGVASDTMLRNLQARGLVNEAGKSTEPGRPMLYSVSHTFMQHFGLTSIRDLPPLPEEE